MLHLKLTQLWYTSEQRNDNRVSVRFLVAKTRVAPLKKLTIPRLELLSALLLSKIIVTVREALDSELTLEDPVCFSDSKVALCWIKGRTQEWRQFVENRVRSIRKAVPIEHWRHCSGVDNPADLPSRGTSVSELKQNPLWLKGPEWLYQQLNSDETEATVPQLPQECLKEIKKSSMNLHVLLATERSGISIHVNQVVDCERFSSFGRLVRVTALILSFIHLLKVKRFNQGMVEATVHITKAKLLWLRHAQSILTGERKFTLWKRQLDLSLDESGLVEMRRKNATIGPHLICSTTDISSQGTSHHLSFSDGRPPNA